MRKQFDFYAYNSPTNGKFYVDETEFFYGEDYRNKKRYKEYKDAGLNILLLQHENSYSGEDFETSACKQCMTEAYRAGIKKIIVSDTRLKDLCVEKNLLGENGRFADRKELLSYLDECTKPYRNQKGFYGVQLYDEPEGDELHSYGLVIKGLKELFPSMYLQCNLLTAAAGERLAGKGVSSLEGFEVYLNKFLDESGMDSLLYDEYPFRRDYIIGGYSLPSYQIAARVCKERGVEFRHVLQSWAWLWTSPSGRISLTPRHVFKEDMYWQLNLLMGFGCREFSFFTYMPKQHIDLNPKLVIRLDGACLLNLDGTKTRLYYHIQKIISEMKRFAPVILQYEYDNNWLFFEEGKSKDDFMQTQYAEMNDGCPIVVKPSSDVALVTKLKKTGSSLFMIQNISNLKDELQRKAPLSYEIDLGATYKKIKIYKNGKRLHRKVLNGKWTETLHCGEAIFVEAFK